MRPTSPREGSQLSASWIVLDQEGEEVALQQRSPRVGHTFNQDEEEVLGVLSLHPDEAAAFTTSAGGRSMWGSMFRMLDRGAMTMPAATTAGEGEGDEEEYDEDERNEDEGVVDESQDQLQEEQQPAAPVAEAAVVESMPAPSEGGEEKGDGGDIENDGWWHRVPSLLMTHVRAILKTLSNPPSCCGLQDELRSACPYLRGQPRQRMLLITIVVPVAMVVGVTAAVVLVGVCASGSSSSPSSTKRGGRESCQATTPSSGTSSGMAKAPLFRVL